MRFLRFSAVAIAAAVLSQAVNGGELTDAEKAAKLFSYDGIKIGTSLNDFKRAYPQARRKESSETENAYRLNDPVSQKSALIEFFNGRCYRIMRIFTSDRVSLVGGHTVLDKRILSTFGKPDYTNDSGNAHLWFYPVVERSIYYSHLNGGSVVQVSDTTAEAVLTSIKADNLDIGF